MSAYVLSNGQRVYPAFVLNDADGGGIVTPPASFRLADGTQVMGVVLVDEDGNIAEAPLGTSGVQAILSDTPYLETFDPIDGDLSVATFSANSCRIMRLPRIVSPFSTSNATIFVGTASGNVDIAVLSSADGSTFTRVASTGSTAVAGTNTTQTIALAVDWEPNTDYWAALALDNATATVARKNLVSPTGADAILTRSKRTGSKASSFPIPATLDTVSFPYGSAYWVLFD